MNQPPQDLEANLLEENNYYVDERLPQDYPQDDAARLPEPNPFQQITGGLDGSPKHNILAIMVSTCKVIATTVIFAILPHTCLSLAEIWLFCMLVHDIFYIFATSLRLKNIYALRNVSQNILEPILAAEQQSSEEEEEQEEEYQYEYNDNQGLREVELEPRPAEQQSSEEEEEQEEEYQYEYNDNRELREVELEPRPAELEGEREEEEEGPKANEGEREAEIHLSDEEVRIVDEIFSRMKRVKLMSRICFVLWSILFVTGIWIYAVIGEIPTCQIPEATNLLLAYVIMSGVWLFSPILLALLLLIGCIFGCILLPLLILVLWIVERPKPANRDAIKKLPIVKFTEDLPGEKQCVICMVDYQPGEKLVQLKCSSMHHFHEKCGKKWFKINGQCPMCRERIDQRPENHDDDEEEEYQD